MSKPTIGVTEVDKNNLESYIRQIIRKQGMEKHVHPFVQDEMAVNLTDFVADAIVKFMQGQLEHGGNITDRDLDHEMRMETIDTFWYGCAKEWQKKTHLGNPI